MLDEQIAKQFGALGQPSRLAIVRLLAQTGSGGLIVGEIAVSLNIFGATLSHHLSQLTRCGLLTASPEGRYIRYRVEIAALNFLALQLDKQFSLLVADKNNPEARPSFASMLLG
ncbi:MAG: winged helix-turn-helix domain-containing protein [Proteobacteria bacterium]|nr:winged helix-turn-helix domain-containing protein [Pseudomonadota bacterium]